MSADVRPSTTEPIVSPILVDSDGDRLAGQTGVTVTIIDPLTGFVWDWSTSAFTATPVTPTQALSAINATHAVGVYGTTWTPPIGVYLAIIDQSPLVAANLPAQAELRVGQVAFPGDAMDLVADALDASALAASAVTEIQAGLATAAAVAALPAAVWATAEGTPLAGTYGYAVQLGRRLITNRTEVDTTSLGRERLFADDATTVLLTWSLRDGTGGAITTPTGSPARRGAAT